MGGLTQRCARCGARLRACNAWGSRQRTSHSMQKLHLCVRGSCVMLDAAGVGVMRRRGWGWSSPKKVVCWRCRNSVPGCRTPSRCILRDFDEGIVVVRGTDQ